MDGVTQVTPYWEGLDGKLTLELSFIQNVDYDGPRLNSSVPGSTRRSFRNNLTKYRSRNYGLGSMSGRVTYAPIEGLKLTASAVNFYSTGTRMTDDMDPSDAEWIEAHAAHKKNNSAVGLAFSYRPCFFSRLNVWSQWVHSWNSNYWKYESDAFNFGASFDITDNLTVFAQGDTLLARHRTALSGVDHNRAWAFYTGVMYAMPIEGLILEAGWKHEKLKQRMKDAAGNPFRIQAKADTIYAHLGFEF